MFLQRSAIGAIVFTFLVSSPSAISQNPQDRSQRPQTRPAPGGNQGGRPPGGGNPGGGDRPNPGGGNRPGPGGGNRPGPGGGNPGNGGGNRPGPGNGGNRPGPGNGGNRPNPGGGNRPGPGNGGNRPGPGNGGNRPGPGTRPPSRPSRPPQWGRPPQNRPSYNFRPNDRSYLRRYYLRNLGYINRLNRPRFAIGGFFPYADISYLTPLPPQLYGYLPPPPPGYNMGYYDGYVVVYDPLTYFIANVVDLLDN